MGNNPVVFVPTHRSYADFILMAFLCCNYDIEIPVVVAGMGKLGYEITVAAASRILSRPVL